MNRTSGIEKKNARRRTVHQAVLFPFRRCWSFDISINERDSCSVALTPAQLSMLLEGIDWWRPVRTHDPQMAV
jgi:hypothetical protein